MRNRRPGSQSSEVVVRTLPSSPIPLSPGRFALHPVEWSSQLGRACPGSLAPSASTHSAPWGCLTWGLTPHTERGSQRHQSPVAVFILKHPVLPVCAAFVTHADRTARSALGRRGELESAPSGPCGPAVRPGPCFVGILGNTTGRPVLKYL